jgi:molybdenum cofactor biosynthesis protein MoaC
MTVQNTFKMIDIAEKASTRRRAIAKGQIHMAANTVTLIKNKQMPKGDVLALAEVAGIMAAKNTPQILPLCHSLLIESVRVSTNCHSDSIEVACEVIINGKTGVEMEALCGVNAALLCIYDLTKGIDPVLSLSQIYLDLKEGGKSGTWTHPLFSKTEESNTVPTQNEKKLAGITSAIITISDRTFRGETTDVSGPTLEAELKLRGALVLQRKLVPDEVHYIQNAIRECCELGAQLILTTGGTGLGPRDVTPEALNNLWTKSIPGFGEMLRNKGSLYTEKAFLSRSEAGLIGDTLVILLPGSPKACKEGVKILDGLLPHALHIIRGGNHAI